MAKDPGIGKKDMATITGVKVHCCAGHEEGDTFEMSCHNPGRLCGFFYHDIFPYIIMLQFGGSFPSDWGGDPDVVELTCIDKVNAETIELKRIKED